MKRQIITYISWQNRINISIKYLCDQRVTPSDSLRSCLWQCIITEGVVSWPIPKLRLQRYKLIADILIDLALRAGRGAIEAVLIPAEEIEVIDALAEICRDPGCPNYGAAPGCPPHVAGPTAFREWLSTSDQAIFIKIDVPMESLLSFEYRDIMKLLHEIVADIEQAAINAGYEGSRGFAGGSCKDLFCTTFTDCNVLERNSECRNPGRSRPSMSGFGVNVSRLKDAAGWNEAAHCDQGNPDQLPMGAVYGLILVG